VSWSIPWTERSLKDLERLHKPLRQRIIAAVERFADTGHGDVRRLRGRDKDIFRLRVGEWRVLFAALDDLVLLVLRVRARGSAYKP
jgi:mRNA interferase RelE/StbE